MVLSLQVHVFDSCHALQGLPFIKTEIWWRLWEIWKLHSHSSFLFFFLSFIFFNIHILSLQARSVITKTAKYNMISFEKNQFVNGYQLSDHPFKVKKSNRFRIIIFDSDVCFNCFRQCKEPGETASNLRWNNLFGKNFVKIPILPTALAKRGMDVCFDVSMPGLDPFLRDSAQIPRNGSIYSGR